MAYGMNDAKQAFVGATIASLLVIIIREKPIKIDPTVGLIVGLAWLYIITKPYVTKSFETKKHAVMNVIVTLAVTTLLSLIFGLVTKEVILTFNFFGSTPWAIMLLAVPTATFWDRMNINNPYDRWYFRRRGG